MPSGVLFYLLPRKSHNDLRDAGVLNTFVIHEKSLILHRGLAVEIKNHTSGKRCDQQIFSHSFRFISTTAS